MTTTAEASPATRPDSLGYHPALDGLRALALFAIVIYHSGVDVAPGAFLSVSTFFTLSGFLITALMLAEQQRDGGISLRSFWSRRLRRLMPAALAAITLIVLLSAWLADSTQRVRLRGDALAALAYVANWRFIAVGDTYGATFDSPSPFTHFWTLAIEEQFYIVLPLLVAGAVLLGKGNRRVIATALGGVALVSVVWSNVLVGQGVSIDRLYFGTDVRSVEILSGALLAVWWMRRREPLGAVGRRVVSVASPLALVAMVVLWAVADLNDDRYYRGGLALYSCLTLLVTVGALQPDGIIRTVLGWRPLVWVGTVSYGAYLVHYPVLLWLDQHSSLGAWTRVGVAVPVTLVVAAVSARFLERPIRSGARVSAGRGGRIGIGAAVATLAVILVVTAALPAATTTDLDAAAELQESVEPTPEQAASTAPRIGVFGDSAALMTARGMIELSRERPGLFVADGGRAYLGCGLIPDGFRLVEGERRPIPEHCREWPADWERSSREHPLDVAVVQLGYWEVHEQQAQPGGPFLTIGEDPDLDAAFEDRLRAAVSTLLDHHGMVVLLSPPDIDVGRVDGRSPDRPAPESDHARMERFREIVGAVAESLDRVEIVDLEAWLARHPEERRIRADGVHFTDETAKEVAGWLAPELVRVHGAAAG